jgi:hypothetical protein
MLFTAALSAALLFVGALAAPANEGAAPVLSCDPAPLSTPATLRLFPDSANNVPADGARLGLDPVRDANANPLLQAYNGNPWSIVRVLTHRVSFEKSER